MIIIRQKLWTYTYYHYSNCVFIMNLLHCCTLAYNCDFPATGLGTSTSKEAKEYFSDMARHRIPFKYTGAEDDASIVLVSSHTVVSGKYINTVYIHQSCLTTFHQMLLLFCEVPFTSSVISLTSCIMWQRNQLNCYTTTIF